MNHQDLIQACQNEWTEYTEHSFVQQLALGELAHSSFLHYLKQDFLFLKQYTRAYALAIYKARTLAEMRMALPSVQALLSSEIAHHVTYCSEWGVSELEMEAEPEAFGTVAYTRFVLDTGMSGDVIDLYAALAPCSIGYGVIGAQLLARESTKLEGNPYANWIKMYGGEEFQSGVQKSITQLDELLADIDLDSQRGQRLCHIFKTATRMEVAFWQQGLDEA
ncbi:thiaminase II [Aliivibrio sp. 1S165]|uniref:thiaminase II n=1 Tax=unclassified Aliivibrio TaxID=2645654 RepID=UPI00080E39E9|nr:MULTISPECIES: thiaminase II [unclassified Aliivibrio]OCH13646.1 thiaminase II [Aliivibrio sp. 1S165]OCH31711.1 thiaminase II [Aliivibrio sp. 1S175]